MHVIWDICTSIYICLSVCTLMQLWIPFCPCCCRLSPHFFIHLLLSLQEIKIVPSAIHNKFEIHISWYVYTQQTICIFWTHCRTVAAPQNSDAIYKNMQINPSLPYNMRVLLFALNHPFTYTTDYNGVSIKNA